ncbi:hypothetical protein JAAARDRAFT_39231 [Jaapia argillacea MUCL 33604]|uniref:Uncharacterized protein n=1 Tax=Jaapia argillacea MUCL 33604 TaxID=933084 RepID=A0A067PFK1_9AGAM|nr:hypothetical protein JAAARDRAFT_39231 [Jaapia argillacea MUCL 33604]
MSIPLLTRQEDDVPAHHANPVVAFIIGLAIITLASILNAAGLNLTKLDHVRTSAIPKASRRKDWLRPLWLLGMTFYILSQLIGSTLALEYMRAEYVAPLGSTSLIFNFLFARFLVGTPVTRNDIYGTIIVILGVIGIVAFGSINSGLSSSTSASHLTSLWRRPNWLIFFFFMSFALISVYIFTSSLDAVLTARQDDLAEGFTGASERVDRGKGGGGGWWEGLKRGWRKWDLKGKEVLERWVAGKGDKTVAWTLGIGWACCGGGLAGGCLVFAKAGVKLISDSLNHSNTGNQFLHVSSIFTFVLLGVTAVAQIVCLNKGLKVYDSTLVVPVFYGVYTATGFLDSLIFNNSTNAYKPWILVLIFLSICVLVLGVVLLTFEKPEAGGRAGAVNSTRGLGGRAGEGRGRGKGGDEEAMGSDEMVGLRGDEHEPEHAERAREGLVWSLGDEEEEDEEDGPGYGGVDSRVGRVGRVGGPGEEGVGLVGAIEGEGVHEGEGGSGHVKPVGDEPERGRERGGGPTRNTLGHRRSASSEATLEGDGEEFGEWKS